MKYHEYIIKIMGKSWKIIGKSTKNIIKIIGKFVNSWKISLMLELNHQQNHGKIHISMDFFATKKCLCKSGGDRKSVPNPAMLPPRHAVELCLLV